MGIDLALLLEVRDDIEHVLGVLLEQVGLQDLPAECALLLQLLVLHQLEVVHDLSLLFELHV